MVTTQYMLGVLFLTAAIDGFIWKAIQADTKQDPEEAELNEQILDASQMDLSRDE